MMRRAERVVRGCGTITDSDAFVLPFPSLTVNLSCLSCSEPLVCRRLNVSAPVTSLAGIVQEKEVNKQLARIRIHFWTAHLPSRRFTTESTLRFAPLLLRRNFLMHK